jgi:hypothetical protein
MTILGMEEELNLTLEPYFPFQGFLQFFLAMQQLKLEDQLRR